MKINYLIGVFICLSAFQVLGTEGYGLVITPGVGVKGIMEVGMPVSNVLAKACCFDICEMKNYYSGADSNSFEMVHTISVPEFGLETELLGGYEEVYTVKICVDPRETKRFKGLLGAGISCASTNGIRRQQVIDAFGAVQQASFSNLLFLAASGENTSLRSDTPRLKEEEMINYPKKGIQFKLLKDTVTMVYVSRGWISATKETPGVKSR